MDHLRTSRRAWFGPNRVGFGYHPQTWQGWLVVAVVVAVVVVAVALAKGALR